MDYPSNLSMFTGEGLQGLLQEAADLTLLGDANRMGQAVSSGDRRGTALNAGLLALGLTPFGAAVKAGKKVIGRFTTSGGKNRPASTYKHYEDGTTGRHGVSSDSPPGTPARDFDHSNKTVFVSRSGVNDVAGLFQNPDMSTKLVPIFENGKAVRMKLVLNSDFGKKKAGEVLADVNVSTRPSVGKYPVEIMQSTSPIGDAGTAVHFGTKITRSKNIGKEVGGMVERNPYPYEARAI